MAVQSVFNFIESSLAIKTFLTIRKETKVLFTPLVCVCMCKQNLLYSLGSVKINQFQYHY